MMNKKSIIASVTIFSLCMILFILLVVMSIKDNTSNTQVQNKAIAITDATTIIAGNNKSITLPYNFKFLPARTAITINTEITANYGQYIYVKSVYAPLRLYANDELIYEYGADGTFPAFMQDPATAVSIVKLPDNESISLRLEYLSPIARDVLTVHPPIVGSEHEILHMLFHKIGFSFIFSLLLLGTGLLLVIFFSFVAIFEKKGIAFLWLGLFSLFSGLWGFGECNLTGLFINNPTLLYIFAFTGLFMFPVPLMLFILTVVEFKNNKPILFIGLFDGGMASIAFLFQLLGVASLSKTMYIFHFFAPFSLCFYSIYILIEWLRYKNKSAKRFLLSISLLAIFSIFELINYSIRITNVLVSLFQIGILLFIIINGVVGVLYMKDALKLRREKQQLLFEMNMLEYTILEQKKHNELVMQSSQKLKQQRHDLKHQLAVLKALNEDEDRQKLTDYLNTLAEQIPTEHMTQYCENMAVNAVISHYFALARQSDIELSIRLIVPEHSEQINDSNLCVIFGNLIENAIEACERMTAGKRFIKLNSSLQYETLIITMDNSFDGIFTCSNGKYYSRKRNDFGVGLSSIITISEKHGGSARFEAKENVFKSSVYIRI